jgi:hypothetical protein
VGRLVGRGHPESSIKKDWAWAPSPSCVSQVTELEQPAYYAVHHLSVAGYMLQHNIYSRDGWLETRELLSQFVHHGLTPAMARRQNRLKVDSGHRTLSFTEGAVKSRRAGPKINLPLALDQGNK